MDAILADESKESDARLERGARGLVLLMKVAGAHCARSPARGREACVAREVNRILVLFGRKCADLSDVLQNDCVMRAVIRRYGP